jgi:hypothetical protein
MKAETEKTVSKQSKAIAAASPARQFKQESDVQFEDRRPEAVDQRELAGKADSSPQAGRIAQLQAMADGSAVGTVQRLGLEEEEPLQGKFKTIQRQGAEEEEELLQGKFETTQKQGLDEEEIQTKSATVQKKDEKPVNNTGLPDTLKSGIEKLSGLSLDDVKVHYNSPKPAQLRAHAFAQGTEIHMARGQEKHLPHEAWHVVQQAQGRVRPTLQAKGVAINDDAGLEQEADAMGAKALQAHRADQVALGPIAQARTAERPEKAPMEASEDCGAAIGAYGGKGHLSFLSTELTHSLQQRAAQRTTRVMPGRAVVQRDHTETGLKKESAIESFSKKIKARATGGKNPLGSTKEWAALSVDAKAAKLVKYVNAELKKAHAPPVGYILDPGTNAGEALFDFGPWNLSIGSNGLDGALSDDMVGELADTVYHESRHAEQWFRIARLKAGESPQPTKAALAASLGIPDAIADAALKHPLKPATKLQKFFHTKKWAERQDVKLAEAQSWYDGIYGANAAHRGEVYADLDNRHADYMALVEEVDAWDVGGKAGAKVRALIASLRVKQQAAAAAGNG